MPVGRAQENATTTTTTKDKKKKNTETDMQRKDNVKAQREHHPQAKGLWKLTEAGKDMMQIHLHCPWEESNVPTLRF